ncbi:adenosylcobinamide-GDP ribazoletransferase [Clostridium sp.]|uniref:adenosylcobinamide-GDP ribazoletransferase n=1 Tax=Clostridium sp. TaxID=1506 RepID=UPI001A5997E1|nr:adenosylcobinamide-GDP ribazoletransferase [Clostridium sp.]MBK5242888.1 adenosylcobinamide-GDP ribazoletransferase [Clostridium sp.]
MKKFILMIQFFTRIPINMEIDIKDDDFAKGIVYFPIVGLLIAIVNVLTYLLFAKVSTGLLPVVMAVLANVLITGALHVDGLADTCDGIYSARKKERMLEIMKDSRLGTNGAVAILFDLILRITLLSSVSETNIIKVILITTIISKTMVAVLAYISPKRKNGLGGLFVGKVSIKNILITLFICGMSSFLIFGYMALVIIGLNVVLMIIFRNYILKRLGVISGDILGAANEVSEIFILVVVIIMQRFLLL